MAKVRAGLVQVGLAADTGQDPAKVREQVIAAHMPLVEEAAKRGVQVLGFPEVFGLPYFCPSLDDRWLGVAERIPDGETTKLMQETAKKHSMVIVAPIFEIGENGAHYCSAAVIDADGSYLGKYRKTHIPRGDHYERHFFSPGDLGYPVFDTAYVRLGAYICYDRHFPEGWRALALNGAEYVVNPASVVAGGSEVLWRLEQPASAAANGVFVGSANRVGVEKPWNIGEFFGMSYVCGPRGEIEAELGRGEDGLLVHDMELDEVRAIRDKWQFFRDRRPEAYRDLVRA